MPAHYLTMKWQKILAINPAEQAEVQACPVLFSLRVTFPTKKSFPSVDLEGHPGSPKSQFSNTNTIMGQSAVCFCRKTYTTLTAHPGQEPGIDAESSLTAGLIVDSNVSWDSPASGQIEILLSTSSRRYHY